MHRTNWSDGTPFTIPRLQSEGTLSSKNGRLGGDSLGFYQHFAQVRGSQPKNSRLETNNCS